jgi:hypothetical protein
MHANLGNRIDICPHSTRSHVSFFYVSSFTTIIVTITILAPLNCCRATGVGGILASNIDPTTSILLGLNQTDLIRIEILADIYEVTTQLLPQQAALIFGERKLSYSELNGLSDLFYKKPETNKRQTEANTYDINR